LRLEKSCQLLENTFLHIKEIGVEVGITDANHFLRDFKAKYKLSPTAYRKQYGEKFKANEDSYK
jgi:AraC-like DNA-binding protein